MGGKSNPESLKQLIQGMLNMEDGSVIEAKVIATGPLKVQATNDEKLILSAATLVVPRHLTDYNTEVTIDWRTEEESGGSGAAAFASHSHAIIGRKKILVHNALQVGEVVYLLRYNDGKKYYILDRKEE